jgi:hypothetical protein
VLFQHPFGGAAMKRLDAVGQQRHDFRVFRDPVTLPLEVNDVPLLLDLHPFPEVWPVSPLLGRREQIAVVLPHVLGDLMFFVVGVHLGWPRRKAH